MSYNVILMYVFYIKLSEGLVHSDHTVTNCIDANITACPSFPSHQPTVNKRSCILIHMNARVQPACFNLMLSFVFLTLCLLCLSCWECKNLIPSVMFGSL